MKIEVTNCNDCLLFTDQNEYGYQCGAPNTTVNDSDIVQSILSKKIPVDCPLIESDILIALKQKSITST